MAKWLAAATAQRATRPLYIAAACLGLLAPAVAGAQPARAQAATPQPAELQVSYSTDTYLTCESLNDEIARMKAIIGQQGAPARVVKTANERKKALDGILKTKTCAPPKEKDFGPGMYN